MKEKELSDFSHDYENFFGAFLRNPTLAPFPFSEGSNDSSSSSGQISSKYQNIKIIANVILILTEDTFKLQLVFVHVQYVLMCNTHFPVFIKGSVPYRSKFLVSLGFLRHFSMDLCSLLLRLINK